MRRAYILHALLIVGGCAAPNSREPETDARPATAPDAPAPGNGNGTGGTPGSGPNGNGRDSAEPSGPAEAGVMPPPNCVASGPESCDGKDNDCDGLVDEELTQDCSNRCKKAERVCRNGQWDASQCPPENPQCCAAMDCAAASCTAGMAKEAEACENGRCVPATPKACAPFACEGTRCAGGCGDGMRLMNGTCVACGGTTQPCCDNNQCAGGACSDGLCCPSGQRNCNGQCQACCAAGDCEARANYTASCQGGSCQYTSNCMAGQPCGNDTDCQIFRTDCAGGVQSCKAMNRSGNCGAGPRCENGQFKGQDTCQSGRCQAPSNRACSGNFECNGNSCRTSCSNIDQCRDGYYCESGKCLGRRKVGEKCRGTTGECPANSSCSSGYCCRSDSMCKPAGDSCERDRDCASNKCNIRGHCPDLSAPDPSTAPPVSCTPGQANSQCGGLACDSDSKCQ